VFFIFIFLLIGAAPVPFETASEGRKGRMMLRCEGDEKGMDGWDGRRGVVVLSGDNEQQVVKAVPTRLL
jgi:hypothetical protein